MTTTADGPDRRVEHAPDPAPRASGVTGAAADSYGEPPYNLAERIHGNGHTNGTGANGNGHANGDAANGASPTPYNLAERIYGNGHTNGTGANGNGHANGESANGASPAVYNLAERIYGNGHTNGTGGAVAVAVAAPPVAAAAQPAWAPAGGRPPRGKFSLKTFESLKNRGFRWYILAMLGQMASMQTQMFIRGYLVFELTGSFALLGVVSLANAVPGLTLSLIGGVVADRLPKKYILQFGQALNMVMAAIIAALLFRDMLTFQHLLVAAAVQGTSNALTMPARQSMVPELVGQARLMNAVALNSAGMSLARLVVPALGGMLVAVAGAGWVYVLMTALYGFAIVTLTRVPRPAAATSDGPMMRRGANGFGDMVDGIKYIWRTPTVRTLLAVNFLIVMVSMPYMMMLPGFVKEVLGGGPSELGVLMSITGIGSVAGSLVIASLPSRNRGKLLLFGSMLLGASLLAFSASTSYWLSAGIIIVVGIGQTTRMSLSNVLLQSYVDDAYRGRVMSIYMMEFSITMFGVFAVGILASIFGVQMVIGATAIGVIVFAVLVYAFVPSMRRLQ